MISRPASDGLAHDFGVSYASGAIVGGTALAGQRAPHAWVAAALVEGRQISTLDLFDGRFTLITGADGSGWRAAADELAETGMPLSVLGLGVEFDDPLGSWSRATGWATAVRPGPTRRLRGVGKGRAERGRTPDALQLASGHRVAELVR